MSEPDETKALIELQKAKDIINTEIFDRSLGPSEWSDTPIEPEIEIETRLINVPTELVDENSFRCRFCGKICPKSEYYKELNCCNDCAPF